MDKDRQSVLFAENSGEVTHNGILRAARDGTLLREFHGAVSSIMCICQ